MIEWIDAREIHVAAQPKLIPEERTPQSKGLQSKEKKYLPVPTY